MAEASTRRTQCHAEGSKGDLHKEDGKKTAGRSEREQFWDGMKTIFRLQKEQRLAAWLGLTLSITSTTGLIILLSATATVSVSLA